MADQKSHVFSSVLTLSLFSLTALLPHKPLPPFATVVLFFLCCCRLRFLSCRCCPCLLHLCFAFSVERHRQHVEISVCLLFSSWVKDFLSFLLLCLRFAFSCTMERRRRRVWASVCHHSVLSFGRSIDFCVSMQSWLLMVFFFLLHVLSTLNDCSQSLRRVFLPATFPCDLQRQIRCLVTSSYHHDSQLTRVSRVCSVRSLRGKCHVSCGCSIWRTKSLLMESFLCVHCLWYLCLSPSKLFPLHCSLRWRTCSFHVVVEEQESIRDGFGMTYDLDILSEDSNHFNRLSRQLFNFLFSWVPMKPAATALPLFSSPCLHFLFYLSLPPRNTFDMSTVLSSIPLYLCITFVLHLPNGCVHALYLWADWVRDCTHTFFQSSRALFSLSISLSQLPFLCPLLFQMCPLALLSHPCIKDISALSLGSRGTSTLVGSKVFLPTIFQYSWSILFSVAFDADCLSVDCSHTLSCWGSQSDPCSHLRLKILQFSSVVIEKMSNWDWMTRLRSPQDTTAQVATTAKNNAE